jgi:hypothetical protein
VLPKNILAVIEDALESIENAIAERTLKGHGHKDLDRLKSNLIEMKLGKRKTGSDFTIRMIVDSMDWHQPCVKKFGQVCTILEKHYRNVERK